jgi:acyl carrier protein
VTDQPVPIQAGPVPTTRNRLPVVRPADPDSAKKAQRKRATVTDDAIFAKFTACAVEVLQVPADKVVREASFADDLDADSLDVVELVMALEETFDITVDESELDGVTTVGEAFDLIAAKL